MDRPPPKHFWGTVPPAPLGLRPCVLQSIAEEIIIFRFKPERDHDYRPIISLKLFLNKALTGHRF